MIERSIVQLALASAFGAITALIGAVELNHLLTFLGTFMAVASAAVAWALSQHAKIRDEQRKQQWADFLLEWRQEQVRAGKLDPTECTDKQ